VTDPREMAFRDKGRDDHARFLRELRDLRNDAGLGHAELAARAHYPCDAIKAAEAGPALPDLPVLSAYVRGCGGTLADWEERWRAVTGSPASPLLAARDTGCSAAADAGARVGAASAFSAFSAVDADSDGQEADRVMAALNRVADGTAAATPVANALSGLAEYVPPGAAQEAPGAASIATDVWTPAAPLTQPADDSDRDGAGRAFLASAGRAEGAGLGRGVSATAYRRLVRRLRLILGWFHR
jgi:hypothetical protein